MTYHSERQEITPVDLRKKAGLTQRQASDQLGVRESTISDWERAISTPSVLLVPKIAECYGCSYEDVVSAFAILHSTVPTTNGNNTN